MHLRNSIAHKTKYNNLSHYSVGNSIDNLGNIGSHNTHNLGRRNTILEAPILAL